MAFFEGFKRISAATARGVLRGRLGGNGPPLLLLHGNPQTHACWHAVVPYLQEKYTLVCPDLPGYGGSFKPAAAGDHMPHSKRAMAADMVDLMRTLGFEGRFFIAGHDRGGRVAHRLALDYPARVKALVTLDIVPTLHHFEHVDRDFAMGYYHWFWLAQPKPFPENIITAAPEAWFTAHCSREPKDLSKFFHPCALDDYISAIRNPLTIQGICEDYRAASTIDLQHDRQSRTNGDKVECPLLVLWGNKGKIGQWYDAPVVWRTYSSNIVEGFGLDAGHFVPEEAAKEVAEHVLRFFDVAR